MWSRTFSGHFTQFSSWLQLKISGSDIRDPGQHIQGPVLKAIVNETKKKTKSGRNLTCFQVNKTVQYTDIPATFIKETLGFLSGFTFSNLNDCIDWSVFPTALKLGDVRQIH